MLAGLHYKKQQQTFKANVNKTFQKVFGIGSWLLNTAMEIPSMISWLVKFKLEAELPGNSKT